MGPRVDRRRNETLSLGENHDVCQVKFTEWTRDDRLRQPVFLGLRKDKNANEVGREEVSAATA